MSDSDIYPTETFIDPLLFPLYLKTNDHTSIDVQVKDDWLLSLYVASLNHEIIDDIKEFKDHKELLNKIFFNTRAHGWCGVQFYKNDIIRVFTSREWSKWLTEVDEKSNKKVRIGFEAKWTDDLGNSWTDELYFDEHENDNGEMDGKCYLFIWEKGNGSVLPNSPSLSAFAIADVSTSILSLSIQIRQILGTISFSSVNPFFYFLKYGESITEPQRKTLMTQMSLVGVSRALGAKGSSLDEIDTIDNASIVNSILAANEFLGYYASKTRLPKSFYLGERNANGIINNTGSGETQDEVDISRKKEFILQHFIPGLEEIFTDQFGTSLPDLYNYYSDLSKEKAIANQKLMKEKEVDENEQSSERTNKKVKTE